MSETSLARFSVVGGARRGWLCVFGCQKVAGSLFWLRFLVPTGLSVYFWLLHQYLFYCICGSVPMHAGMFRCCSKLSVKLKCVMSSTKWFAKIKSSWFCKNVVVWSVWFRQSYGSHPTNTLPFSLHIQLQVSVIQLVQKNDSLHLYGFTNALTQAL